MKKLKLNIENLAVQSFTAGESGTAGTVRGHVSEGDDYDSGCGPCTMQKTCAGTCPQTCPASCNRTCNTTCDTSLYPMCPC